MATFKRTALMPTTLTASAARVAKQERIGTGLPAIRTMPANLSCGRHPSPWSDLDPETAAGANPAYAGGAAKRAGRSASRFSGSTVCFQLAGLWRQRQVRRAVPPTSAVAFLPLTTGGASGGNTHPTGFAVSGGSRGPLPREPRPETGGAGGPDHRAARGEFPAASRGK
ncbi:MAG TPA: hypothetical protein VIL46_16565 [Gemmataceae bacterium]